VDGQIGEVERELEERELPVRLRDKRAETDDGYEDYLTVAEATARMVRVAASREKLKLLKGYRRRLKKEIR